MNLSKKVGIAGKIAGRLKRRPAMRVRPVTEVRSAAGDQLMREMEPATRRLSAGITRDVKRYGHRMAAIERMERLGIGRGKARAGVGLIGAAVAGAGVGAGRRRRRRALK